MKTIEIQSSIDIDAPLAQVFRLLCDPARLTRLNPEVGVLEALTQSPGPIGLGSVLHYRLRTRHGVRDFHCRVTGFERNRMIETLSDTQPPFRVRQSLEAGEAGCRLRHQEQIGLEEFPQQTVVREQTFSWLFRLLQRATDHAMQTPEDLNDLGQEALRVQMQQTLAVWLENIKTNLESTGSDVATDERALISTLY